MLQKWWDYWYSRFHHVCACLKEQKWSWFAVRVRAVVIARVVALHAGTIK